MRVDKLERMLIEWECTRLSAAFAYHLDRRDYEAVAALFAPDGVWIRHGVRLEGAAQIIAALEQRPVKQFTRHVTAGFHFTHVKEVSARSVSSNMSYFSFDAEVLPAPYVPEKAMLLDFVDHYAKTPEGWRFRERDTQMVFIPEEVHTMASQTHK
jgi:hypothetical protein